MKLSQPNSNRNINAKLTNRSNIYRLIWESDGISRQTIAATLNLSLPTVIGNIQEFQQEGLIEQSGFVGNTGGRKAQLYNIVARARTAIGLDLTKNHITAVAVDLHGCIISTLRIRHPFSYDDNYFIMLGKVVKQLIQDARLDTNTILGVGIGIPGLVTADNATVFYGEILHFTGATRDKLASHIPYPTLLFNDANAAAFAEIWNGSNIENAFYIMLSNNVGGAIFIDNKVYTGEGLRSGEVGHISIVRNGKQCYCGQRGCVDAYCAATVLSDMTDSSLEKFFKLLKLGDSSIKKCWDTYLTHLSLAVSTVHTLFDCRIILGGYVGSYIDEYLDDLKSKVLSLESLSDNADYLVTCRYKTESIASGAALNFISHYISNI